MKYGPVKYGRMARGDHGLRKVSLGPAMPDLSMLCRRATLETALRQGGLLADVYYTLGHPTLYPFPPPELLSILRQQDRARKAWLSLSEEHERCIAQARRLGR
jgi:hypothetical protein